MRKKIVFVLLFSALAVQGFGQIASPPSPDPATQSQQVASVPPALAQSINELNQVAQSAVMNLGRVRIDKWKVDDRSKSQAKSNVESLQRNLTAALPAIEQQVQANPSSLAALVKLYRNLNAVYDVLASVTESTGAFGSKDDYNNLAADTANFDNVRRSIADQLEQMASNQDAQLARIAAQMRAQQAATAAPPKKVVVDDTAPAKKPAKKKTSSSKTQ